MPHLLKLLRTLDAPQPPRLSRRERLGGRHKLRDRAIIQNSHLDDHNLWELGALDPQQRAARSAELAEGGHAAAARRLPRLGLARDKIEAGSWHDPVRGECRGRGFLAVEAMA